MCLSIMETLILSGWFIDNNLEKTNDNKGRVITYNRPHKGREQLQAE